MPDPIITNIPANQARSAQIKHAENVMGVGISVEAKSAVDASRPWGAPKPEQNPTELLKLISNKVFYRLAKCEKDADRLEKKRVLDKSVIQLDLERKQSSVMAESDRLCVEINKLNDLLAAQKSLETENDQWASNLLESVDIACDKELEANATIKRQMIAALAAGENFDPEVREVEVSS